MKLLVALKKAYNGDALTDEERAVIGELLADLMWSQLSGKWTTYNEVNAKDSVYLQVRPHND